MKKKTINAVICKKFDEWLSSIKDDKVRGLVESNSIISGGCIASMLLKEKVNDYDVYFTNKETVLAVSRYYVEKFNNNNGDNGYVLDGALLGSLLNISEEYRPGTHRNMSPDRVKIIFKSKGVASEAGMEAKGDEDDAELRNGNHIVVPEKEDDKPKYRPVFLSSNAITLSNKIQLVIRFYGNAEAIHENYDFVHCTNYWDSKTRQLVLRQSALESILSKELIYVGSKYPLCSVIRTRKFLRREWTINAGQYLKMAFQISKLNLEDIDVLEDQLTGVDVVYFVLFINALRMHAENEKAEGREFKVEYSYLATIIDKMF